MLAGGLPEQLCNGDEQRPHGANSINQSLADQEAHLLGGLRFWIRIKASETGTQLSIWHRTLRAQGNKFAEQRLYDTAQLTVARGHRRQPDATDRRSGAAP